MVNKYTEKYRKIVDELIRKSFPRLKGKKIFFFNFILYGTFVSQVLDFSFIKFLFTNPKKVERYTYSEQKALFAHELCHFERHMNKSFFSKILYLLKYVFLKKIRFEEENETDKLTMRRGYAKELYDFTKRLDKQYDKKTLKKIYAMGYMNLEQIKVYAKKIGKW